MHQRRNGIVIVIVMVIVMVTVIVTVLVIVMRNSESLILGHLDFLVVPLDPADLVDLVVNIKPLLVYRV